MAAMNVPGLDDNTTLQEHYTFSYDSGLTRKLHASRTAASHAAFFLPYLQPGMSLLDCGCGSGSITVGLAKIVAPGQVTGVDISEVEVARARDRATADGIANVHFEVGNVYKLAFPAESFDAVFSHNVLEHVAQPLKALDEMHRVLKPGGIIGIRDVDGSGLLFCAAADVLHEYWSLHEAVWKMAGGDPRMGRRLLGLLREAGFVDVVASASYDVYGDSAKLKFASEIMTNRCEEPDFVSQVVEHGLADQERIEEIKAALQVWPEHPYAFLASAHGEVVGRKR
jgi:ubiquinone/menaquinone biosynthesis C-methylase UbiE